MRRVLTYPNASNGDELLLRNRWELINSSYFANDSNNKKYTYYARARLEDAALSRIVDVYLCNLPTVAH